MSNKTSSLNAEDRQQFLTVRSRVVPRFHLLVETPEGNLSKAMRPLNGIYTQTFQHRHQRVGHLAEFVWSLKAVMVPAWATA